MDEPEASMNSIVTRKGQITVPQWVRDRLDIGPGSEIAFERIADGRIVLVKVEHKAEPSRFARLRGHAGKGPSTEDIMAMLRSEC
jgi:antitoxin PrlF